MEWSVRWNVGWWSGWHRWLILRRSICQNHRGSGGRKLIVDLCTDIFEYNYIKYQVAFKSRPSSNINRLIPLENSPFQQIRPHPRGGDRVRARSRWPVAGGGALPPHRVGWGAVGRGRRQRRQQRQRAGRSAGSRLQDPPPAVDAAVVPVVAAPGVIVYAIHGRQIAPAAAAGVQPDVAPP
jgi:hypothetical protein